MILLLRTDSILVVGKQVVIHTPQTLLPQVTVLQLSLQEFVNELMQS